MVTVLLAILAFLLIGVGFLGVFLPVLPGMPLAWLGLFVFAIGTGFEKVSVLAVILFGVFMLLSLLLDFLAPMIGAKKNRASKWGIFGTTIGLIVGLMVFGPWGIILGPFLGAFLGEMIAARPAGQALKAAAGAFIGFIFGTMLRVVYIFVVLGYLIYSLF